MYTRGSALLSKEINRIITDKNATLGAFLKKTPFSKIIENLFANNEQGFFYDPNDLSTMYQDAAGTTQVLLTGQPVGLIKDKSGNGLNATQVDSSKRPLLKSIPYFLEYDNVDDVLVVNIAETLTNCTVITSTRNLPATILTNQTIPAGAFEIKPERAHIVINRALTALETTLITKLLKKQLTDSVVAQSGGEQTVLYTAKGQPTYMNIIQKFDLSTIDASLSGIHPAFIVDGVEKPEIFVGTYQGRLVNGELLSLPNVDPSASINFDNFSTYARACGAGHHLMTNAEWSAVALQCYKNDTQPFGNTYYGRSSENPLLIGRRQDRLDPGNTAGTARTLTGSGPVEWRHNRKPSGIADLSGNVWEWSAGMRIFNGEIQVIADNNAALHTIDMSATSAQWKAIDAVTGNLVTPDGNGTTVGTVKFANSGTADYTINGASFGAIRNLSTTNPVSAAALARLKALCLYPVIEDTAKFNSDYFSKDITAERVPIRGGGWNSAAGAGVFALSLHYARSYVNTIVGARPAFVNL